MALLDFNGLTYFKQKLDALFATKQEVAANDVFESETGSALPLNADTLGGNAPAYYATATSVASSVKFDQAQTLSTTQQSQARSNILAPGGTVTLESTDPSIIPVNAETFNGQAASYYATQAQITSLNNDLTTTNSNVTTVQNSLFQNTANRFYISGGLKICWGTVSVTTGTEAGTLGKFGSASVSYPFTFSSVPSVFTNVQDDAGYWNSSCKSIATSGFIAHLAGDQASTTKTVNWVAIGI